MFTKTQIEIYNTACNEMGLTRDQAKKAAAYLKSRFTNNVNQNDEFEIRRLMRNSLHANV